MAGGSNSIGLFTDALGLIMTSVMTEQRRDDRWLLLVLLCLPTMSILLSTNIVMASLVPIGKAFPNVPSIGEWTLIVYSLTAASLSIPAGDLGDRYGLRRLYTYGLIIFIAGACLAAVANSASLLILGRILSGVGSAVLAPVALAFMNRLFSGKEKPVAFGYWSASVTLGTVIGPLLGGWIESVSNWRFVFPAAAIPTIFALVMLYRLPTYASNQKLPPMDIRGFIGLALLPFLTLYTITMGSGLTASILITLLAVIVGLFFWTWRHLHVSNHPAINLRRLLHAQWWRPSMLQLLIRCLFMAMLVLLTGYFHSIQGKSELDSTLALLPFCLAVGAMSFTSGFACKRLGVRRLMVMTFLIAFAGALTLLSVDAIGFRWMDWLAVVAVGVLVGNTAQLSRLAMANFPAEESMRGASVNTLIINLGLSLGAALPTLVRSIKLPQLRLSDIIPKQELLDIMHIEIMVLILLFSLGLWQAFQIKEYSDSSQQIVRQN